MSKAKHTPGPWQYDGAFVRAAAGLDAKGATDGE